MAQDAVFSARVVEAETGEVLPLVSVYVSEDVNTLTNFDGEFSIAARPDDVLRLTCIGRRTLTIKASELPAVIRMPMLESVMSEVTVKGVESLLTKVAKQMEKSYNSKKAKEAQYFYRQTSLLAQKQDIVEAFVGARSAVNLRQVGFISGRHGAVSRKHWEESALRNMNLHHIIELSPMPFDVPFWENLVTPLPRWNTARLVSAQLAKQQVIAKSSSDLSTIGYLQYVYNIRVEEMQEGNQELYVFHMSLRDGLTLQQPVLTGTLYIDKKKLQVLAFDGRVENMKIQLRRSQLQSPINIPVGMKFHIDYRYEHKYAEVADLSMHTDWKIEGGNEGDLPLLAELNTFQTRTLLFNVDGQKRMKQRAKKAKLSGENMLSAISEAGYDSTFWANNDVVKRTAEEEAIANGVMDREQALRDSLNAYIEGLTPMARLSDRLKRFGRTIPQEKVYVHMDNTGYFLGDTIWFAAYLRKTNTDTPSRMSRVLYAELWNHDGYLVERKLIEMKDGRGHGVFALPDTLYSGYFELRAYTRWQLNWGQTEHPHVWSTEYRFYNKAMAKDFFRDYEKLYSRVFPVYDKPKEAGDFYKDMTFRPLRRYFKTDPKAPELRLSLFPEGGNLVAGLPCRVAFEAATSEGEMREGTLRLYQKGKEKSVETKVRKSKRKKAADADDESPNRRGNWQQVLTAHTVNRGRGTFTFTPEEGKTYEAVFTEASQDEPSRTKDVAAADKKASTARREASQTIKAVKPEGVALQVHLDTLSGQWRFDIAARGQAASHPLGVTVMNEGRVVMFEELGDQPHAPDSPPALPVREGADTSETNNLLQASESKGFCHSIHYAPSLQGRAGGGSGGSEGSEGSSSSLGIHQVTVFDSIGHIYADRLFFVTRPDLTQPTLQFTGVKDQYEPFEPIEFDVTAADILPDMTISLAVRDAVHTDNTFDTGNIMTEMLLSSEIKGFVPQPEYFFERDDEEHRQALDLLMMTQGWRRFNWQDMAVAGAWDITHPAEHTQMVSGTVNRYSIYEEEDLFSYNNERWSSFTNNHDFNFFGVNGNSIGSPQSMPGINRDYSRPSSISDPFGESRYWMSDNRNWQTLRSLKDDLFKYSANTYSHDMTQLLMDRTDIGAIADTYNGIYSMQGHNWLNTDYNVLSRHQDKRYRQIVKDRMSRTARRYIESGNLKRDVTVHAEFINPFNPKNIIVGESMTQNGRFTIDLPRFTGECYFHLAAADTTKWYSERKPKRAREDKRAWIKIESSTPEKMLAHSAAFRSGISLASGSLTQSTVTRAGALGMYDYEMEHMSLSSYVPFVPDVPEYYVRINFPYPRWIKPYTYYQVHDAPLRVGAYLPSQLLTDGTHLMDEVTIRSRHGGLRHLDYSKPAYVLDAYDAANLGVDAGLTEYTFDAQKAAGDAVTVLIGDMGMERHYDYDVSVDGKGPGYSWGPLDAERNKMLTYFDKFYIYTDYSPRREGDERYEQANQPSVRVDMRRFQDGSERAVFVNRHFVLPGFAYQEDFYHPDYQRNPPVEGQKDYRRTLYWNPELKLDNRGQARVRLFNNSQYTSLLIEGEGQTTTGSLLFGR